MKKKPKAYTVYGHCNLTKDKWYVGMTSLEPKKGWNNGKGYNYNTQMWKDIQESNWNNDWIHTIFDTFYNREDALDFEAFLIGMLDSIGSGYNASAYSSHSCKHSEESKNKISEALTGEKNHMYGKHHSEETKKKMAESHTGRTLSEEIRKKISDSQPKNPVLQFSKTGEFIAEYPSSKEAERQTGCHSSHICNCCKGTRKSTGGFIWKYKEAS